MIAILSRRRSPALAMAGLLASVVLLCTISLNALLLPHDGALGRDFLAFYAAGRTVQHGHNPYDWTQLGATEARLRSIGDPRLPFTFNQYANPPLFAWAMGALARLPAGLAFALWDAAMLAALLGGMVLLARSYGVREQGWLLLCFVVTPAPVICFFLGQQTPLLLLGLAVALVALRRGWPAVAGVALTAGWIKPHLLFPLVLVLAALLSWREARRLAAGFLGVSVALALAAWLTTGGGLLAAWVGDLLWYGHTMAQIQPALSSLAGLYLGTVPAPWSTLLTALCLGAWAVFAALLVRSARAQGLTPSCDAWLARVAAALAAWLLATPYTHPADLVLLAAALPVLLGRRLEGLADPWVRLSIGVLLAAPEADLLGFRPNFTLTYSMLLPLMVLLALRPWVMLRPAAHVEQKERVA